MFFDLLEQRRNANLVRYLSFLCYPISGLRNLVDAFCCRVLLVPLLSHARVSFLSITTNGAQVCQPSPR